MKTNQQIEVQWEQDGREGDEGYVELRLKVKLGRSRTMAASAPGKHLSLVVQRLLMLLLLHLLHLLLLHLHLLLQRWCRTPRSAHRPCICHSHAPPRHRCWDADAAVVPRHRCWVGLERRRR